MWYAVLALIKMVPIIGGAVTAFVNKYYDAKVQITAAKIGGDTAVARAAITAAVTADKTRVDGLRVVSGSWVLSLLVLGFATPLVVWEWKVVVWDIVLRWGTTDPIRDPMIQAWAGTIIACLFGSGTVLTIAHTYFNRRQG